MPKELAIVALALASATVATASMLAENRFAEYKAAFNKVYAHAEEEQMRKMNFNENMKKAAELRQLNPYANFGQNEFSDLSAAEFKRYHNADAHYKAHTANLGKIPNIFTKDQIKDTAAVDWRTKGAVTAVKNQGECGSCWSFSTTGNIEGQWSIAGNGLVSLSEQQLVSCDTVDSGCNGGLMDNAFGWLLNSTKGWIATDASYPYVSGSGNVPSCTTTSTNGAQIISYINLPQDESQMGAWMLTNGPISIAIDATSWQTYTGGILSNCISQQIDHGVLIVGFDDTNVPPYWIIKNSWGASWGESGYIRVVKGTNQCLITTCPCSSVVDASLKKN